MREEAEPFALARPIYSVIATKITHFGADEAETVISSTAGAKVIYVRTSSRSQWC